MSSFFWTEDKGSTAITPSLNLQGYIWHKQFHHIFPNLWGWIRSMSPYKFVPTFCRANQAMTVLLRLKCHLNTPLSVSWHSLSSYFLSNGHLPWLCPSPLSPSLDFPLFILQVGSSPTLASRTVFSKSNRHQVGGKALWVILTLNEHFKQNILKNLTIKHTYIYIYSYILIYIYTYIYLYVCIYIYL